MAEPLRDGDFWRGPVEAAVYLAVVRENPRREGEGVFAYIARLSEIARCEESASSAWNQQAGGHAHFEEPVE